MTGELRDRTILTGMKSARALRDVGYDGAVVIESLPQI